MCPLVLSRHEHCSSAMMMSEPAGASPIALLLVDVINDLDFPGSGPLIKEAQAMAKRLARLAARARKASVPVIYVNDNFGRWQSDWRMVVQRCRDKSSPGRRVVELLLPSRDDYFVLKP